jgi:hypothetical protein
LSGEARSRAPEAIRRLVELGRTRMVPRSRQTGRCDADHREREASPLFVSLRTIPQIEDF